MKRKIEHIPGAKYERNYIYNFHFHLIWVTKYRHPIFTTPDLVQEMKQLLSKIAELNDIQIEKLEVLPEHVHLLLSCKPKYAPANLVKALKGGSARLFFQNHPEIKHDHFWAGHLWSHSYYMSTLGDMSRKVVETYIDNQYTK